MQLSLLAFKYSLWMTNQISVGEGTERKIHIFFFLIPLPAEYCQVLDQWYTLCQNRLSP